jgi:rhodanese-related sulfurtransferase
MFLQTGGFEMKKRIVIALSVMLLLGTASLTFAGDNPLRAEEKKVNASFVALIPADKIIDVDKFYQVYQNIMAGKKKAYLIDVRSYPEFDAFHIEGTDHINSGLMYTIPKKIKDPNAEIYVWCRTSKRAKYTVGFLYKYGYKNVWLYKGGVVGWAKAGHPFVNKYTGKFNITEYRKHPSDAEKSYRIR